MTLNDITLSRNEYKRRSYIVQPQHFKKNWKSNIWEIWFIWPTKAGARRCSSKLVFAISQYSYESTCVGASFFADLRPATLLKRDSNTIFFSIRVFFHGHWQLTGQQQKGGDHLLFYSTTSTCSQIFRHLFATFCM